jgi:hypothetical protein
MDPMMVCKGVAYISRCTEIFFKEHGVVVVDPDHSECTRIMQEFIRNNTPLRNEDIGGP